MQLQGNIVLAEDSSELRTFRMTSFEYDDFLEENFLAFSGMKSLREDGVARVYWSAKV